MSEFVDSQKIHSWRDIDFRVEKDGNNLLFLEPIDNGVVSSTNVERTKNLARKSVDLLLSLPLACYQREKPLFSVVFVPPKNFLKVTKIPEGFNWATICSREVWQKDREDAVVVSYNHNGRGVDGFREMIHEFCPTLRDTFSSSFPFNRALPVTEAMDEVVPRYVFDLQKKMGRSTKFLVNLSDNSILTVAELWKGFSLYDTAPVSKNIAYASAFLWGAGLMLKIQKEFDFNPVQALSFWLETMFRAELSSEIIPLLGDEIKIPSEEMSNGKLLQEQGRNWVRSFLS